MSVRTLVKSIQDIMRKDTGVDGDAQRISQLCWMFFLKIIDDQDQEFELTKENYTSPIPANLQWRAWAADPEGVTGDTLLGFVNNTLFPELKTLPVNAGPRAKVVRDVFEDAYNYMKSGQLLRGRFFVPEAKCCVLPWYLTTVQHHPPHGYGIALFCRIPG